VLSRKSPEKPCVFWISQINTLGMFLTAPRVLAAPFPGPFASAWKSWHFCAVTARCEGPLGLSPLGAQVLPIHFFFHSFAGTAVLRNAPFSSRFPAPEQPVWLTRSAGWAGARSASRVTEPFSSGCWWSPARDIPAWLKPSSPSRRGVSRRWSRCVEPAAGSSARRAPAPAATQPGGMEKGWLSPRGGEYRRSGGSSEVVRTI